MIVFVFLRVKVKVSASKHPVELTLQHVLASTRARILALDTLVVVGTNGRRLAHLGELPLRHTMIGVGLTRLELHMKVLRVTIQNQRLDDAAVGGAENSEGCVRHEQIIAFPEPMSRTFFIMCVFYFVTI